MCAFTPHRPGRTRLGLMRQAILISMLLGVPQQVSNQLECQVGCSV